MTQSASLSFLSIEHDSYIRDRLFARMLRGNGEEILVHNGIFYLENKVY